MAILKKTPTITIITATYNAADTLPRLLNSLAEQTCRDFELIIQDGASTDATVLIAESWRDSLPHLLLVSEKDTGIYDAWNKALPYIRGKWVLFLGADDRLITPDTLMDVCHKLEGTPHHVLYGIGAVIVRDASERDIEFDPGINTNITRHLAYRMPLPHQGLFHKATLFQSHTFDASYKICGDRSFLSKTLFQDSQALKLDLIISVMYLGGISTNQNNLDLFKKESRSISFSYKPIRYVLHKIKGYLRDTICRFCKKNIYLRFIYKKIKMFRTAYEKNRPTNRLIIEQRIASYGSTPLFRNDDVSPDTNLTNFKKFCSVFYDAGFTQIHGVNLRGCCNVLYKTDKIAVEYEGQFSIATMCNSQIRSLSTRKIEDRQDLIQFLNTCPDSLALHGLYHTDYSVMTYEEQLQDIQAALSIMTKLFSNKRILFFIPPYNRSNEYTFFAAAKCGLTVLGTDGVHLEDSLNYLVLYNGVQYRYHHHRFYPESTYEADLNITKLCRALTLAKKKQTICLPSFRQKTCKRLGKAEPFCRSLWYILKTYNS